MVEIGSLIIMVSIALVKVVYPALKLSPPGCEGSADGQCLEQKPQLPRPPTWTPLLLVRVEHHGEVSPELPPSKVHPL